MAENHIKGRCVKCRKGFIDRGPLYKSVTNNDGTISEYLIYYCTICNYPVKSPCKDVEESK